MKRLLILALLIGFTGIAQVGESTNIKEAIVVGRAFKDNGWQQPVTLEYIDTPKGKHYRLYYQNEEYLGTDRYSSITDIRSIYFYASDKELEYLYNFLLEGIDNEERRKLELGEGYVVTQVSSSYKGKGIITVFVFNENGESSYFRLAKKTLDRVFGKRK